MKFAFPLRIKFLNMLYNEGVMYMKEFCKWLGVSDKTAKVVICLFVCRFYGACKKALSGRFRRECGPVLLGQPYSRPLPRLTR